MGEISERSPQRDVALGSTGPAWYASLESRQTGLPLTDPGLPHRLKQDDIYENMYIPEGTLVFANIWCAAVPAPSIVPSVPLTR